MVTKTALNLSPEEERGSTADEAIVAELHADEIASPEVTEAEIEDKYDKGQAKIFVQRNDFLIPNILSMVKERDILDVSPSYQRRSRWTDMKKSHLMESLLMNVPIPPIFLYEHDFAKYEVMDGQQRLAAIRTFFDNEFELVGLKKWPELNGRRFRDLPPRIQAGLTRRGLAAVIILTESSQDEGTAKELRQYVFERLNTGGVQLNPQEVRNSIYASPFNDVLIKLARHELFTSVWGIPPRESAEPYRVSRKLERNRLYSTMSDCEMVLRFFALSDLSRFKGGMKKTLDTYMDSMRKISKEESEQMEREYLHLLNSAVNVYDDALFRLPDKSGQLRGRRSVPLMDAVLLGLREVSSSIETLIARREDVVEGTRELLVTPDSYETLVGRGNTKSDIEKRILSLAGLFHQVIGG